MRTGLEQYQDFCELHKELIDEGKCWLTVAYYDEASGNWENPLDYTWKQAKEPKWIFENFPPGTRLRIRFQKNKDKVRGTETIGDTEFKVPGQSKPHFDEESLFSRIEERFQRPEDSRAWERVDKAEEEAEKLRKEQMRTVESEADYWRNKYETAESQLHQQRNEFNGYVERLNEQHLGTLHGTVEQFTAPKQGVDPVAVALEKQGRLTELLIARLFDAKQQPVQPQYDPKMAEMQAQLAALQTELKYARQANPAPPPVQQPAQNGLDSFLDQMEKVDAVRQRLGVPVAGAASASEESSFLDSPWLPNAIDLAKEVLSGNSGQQQPVQAAPEQAVPFNVGGQIVYGQLTQGQDAQGNPVQYYELPGGQQFGFEQVQRQMMQQQAAQHQQQQMHHQGQPDQMFQEFVEQQAHQHQHQQQQSFQGQPQRPQQAQQRGPEPMPQSVQLQSLQSLPELLQKKAIKGCVEAVQEAFDDFLDPQEAYSEIMADPEGQMLVGMIRKETPQAIYQELCRHSNHPDLHSSDGQRWVYQLVDMWKK